MRTTPSSRKGGIPLLSIAAAFAGLGLAILQLF